MMGWCPTCQAEPGRMCRKITTLDPVDYFHTDRQELPEPAPRSSLVPVPRCLHGLEWNRCSHCPAPPTPKSRK